MNVAPVSGQVVEVGPAAGFRTSTVTMLVDRWFPQPARTPRPGRARVQRIDTSTWGYLTGWNVELGTDYKPFTYRVKLEGLKLVTNAVH
jgi:hypothetical protein